MSTSFFSAIEFGSVVMSLDRPAVAAAAVLATHAADVGEAAEHVPKCSDARGPAARAGADGHISTQVAATAHTGRGANGCVGSAADDAVWADIVLAFEERAARLSRWEKELMRPFERHGAECTR